MKKILLAILLLLALFTLLTHVLIPGRIFMEESRVIATTSGGFDTCLHKLAKWKQWWPAESVSGNIDSSFLHNGCSYKLAALYTDGATIEVESGNTLAGIRIQTLPKNRDSITAAWRIVLPTSNNSFTRFSRYLEAEKLRKSMNEVFIHLCDFAGKTESVYGFPIERTTFTETTLIAYRFKSAAYPSATDIYDAIGKLRQYLISRGASERYYPMMNTKPIDSSQFETMIAISIDKMIPGMGGFFISQMVPMKDRFLATEVTGGYTIIAKAYIAIEKYMEDHSLSAPARPFEILITDRSKETDTAKWKTKLFYPSM